MLILRQSVGLAIGLKNRDMKSLKWFLIKRFVMIMLFIYISEELLSLAYRWLVAPFLTEIMHVGGLSIVTQDGSLMLLALQVLLLSLAALLPEGISAWVKRSIGENIEDGLYLTIDSPALAGVDDPRTIGVYRLAIIFIFMGVLFLTILPYLISAYWYYRAVSVKVKELLQKEKEQKANYDRQRNLLLSDIAHDIKTPITTVVGYARVLADGIVEDEEKKAEYLQAIYAKSMRVDELISVLFEYVKLDSDGFILHKGKEDVGELLRENIALLYADFEENGMELVVSVPEEKFPYEVDKIQMGRAITNILTNAVKYNPKGTRIVVSLQEEYQQYQQYVIRIADNGTPIEDELAAHIFEPFARGDKARSSKGGNGLGLSISSKIIAMHGGRLQLERKCADGCAKAFLISLPL